MSGLSPAISANSMRPVTATIRAAPTIGMIMLSSGKRRRPARGGGAATGVVARSRDDRLLVGKAVEGHLPEAVAHGCRARRRSSEHELCGAGEHHFLALERARFGDAAGGHERAVQCLRVGVDGHLEGLGHVEGEVLAGHRGIADGDVGGLVASDGVPTGPQHHGSPGFGSGGEVEGDGADHRAVTVDVPVHRLAIDEADDLTAHQAGVDHADVVGEQPAPVTRHHDSKVVG